MAEGEKYNPNSLAAADIVNFALYGPNAAEVYKNSFLPLSQDAARYNAQNYNTYAPGMNATGQGIYNSNARNQVALDNELLNSPAAQGAITRADALQRQVDPEYYKGRELGLGGLQDLYGRIAQTPDQERLAEEGNLLSGSEMASMERGLNRVGGNTPSAISTAGNAMMFGEAGRNKLMQNRQENRTAQAFKPGLLSSAIQSTAQALPTFRSGLDPYKIATGKSAQANYGQGVSGEGGTGSQFGSQVWGGMNAGSIASQGNTANNKSSTLEQLPSYS